MLAVIGGTGFAEFSELDDIEELHLDTAYGASHILKGVLADRTILFLPRHGIPPSTPPHRINYRANIQALKEAGASVIVAVNAVGSVDPSLEVPHLVIPDRIIDYTWGREHTFYDDEIHHIDFTHPYDPALRASLIQAAASLREVDDSMPYRDSGVYGCTQGPRLETAAEIQRLAADGCHVVGMTGMPEAALARERNIPYASLSIVVNTGAGIKGPEVDLAGIEPAILKGMGWVREIVRYLAACM